MSALPSTSRPRLCHRHFPLGRFALLMMAFLLSTPVLAAGSDPGTLSAQDRGTLVQWLEQSRSELESLAAEATGEAWTAKPDPERWSVGEVVEHVVLAEEGFLTMIGAALAGEENPEWRSIAEGGVDALVTTIQDRSQSFPAPPNLEPTGELGRDDLLARYAAVRVKTLDFVRSTRLPILRFTATGPPGTLNVHQWVALLAAHNLRHNKQIVEAIAAASKE